MSIGVGLKRGSFNPSTAEQIREDEALHIKSCSSDANENIYAGEDGKFITILPGWGDHSYRITTHSDSCQIYFNQGLTMYYGYHVNEAIASFKEAARFDSSCAMAYWGQALAMGPTYNYGYGYTLNEDVFTVLDLMNFNAANASSREKELINAMKMRYNPADASDKQRKELNGRYGAAMKLLVTKYPDDPDVKALYVDAAMLIHPWDFWNNNGKPKSWTPELTQYCKDILKEDPHHPAGLHYYIHLTEASRNPEVALPNADSLIKLFPGIAHMVHMSSHEYERTGIYAKGVEANEKADRSIFIYDSLAKGLFSSIHNLHYYAVETYCALSGAMYNKAISKAMDCRNMVLPTYEDNYGQYMHMLPVITMVRMGKWQDILRDSSSVNPEWIYAGILNDFAKGMAYAKEGDLIQGENCLNRLQQKQKDKILQTLFSPYMSSPYECSLVAKNILTATILFNQKKYGDAIPAINKAILSEDSLLYVEPKIWMLPARQYAGAFLLQLNKPNEAEKFYREDLRWNPGNGWSLLGLYLSLKEQQKTRELKKLKTLYMQSFSAAEVLPYSSVY